MKLLRTIVGRTAGRVGDAAPGGAADWVVTPDPTSDPPVFLSLYLYIWPASPVIAILSRNCFLNSSWNSKQQHLGYCHHKFLYFSILFFPGCGGHATCYAGAEWSGSRPNPYLLSISTKHKMKRISGRLGQIVSACQTQFLSWRSRRPRRQRCGRACTVGNREVEF